MVSTEQLLACGLVREAVEYRSTEYGRVSQVTTPSCSDGGGSVVVSGEFPPLAREQAALLVCDAGIFLSCHTAACVWAPSVDPSDVEVAVVDRYPRNPEGSVSI
jgi:hypothetical protein